MLAGDDGNEDTNLTPNDAAIRDYAAGMVRQGREIFRFDTFGDEAFWGGVFTCIKLSPVARMAGTDPDSARAQRYRSD